MILVVVLLKKQGKLKEEKEKIGFIKKTMAFILGSVIDVVIVFALLLTLIQAYGGKIGVGVEQEKANVKIESGSSAKRK